MFKKKLIPFSAAIGFTLIELLLVIIVIGIISVTLMPRWMAPPLNVSFEARRVLTDIRYVQALSMLSGQRYRWVRLSSNSYQITNQAGAALLLPSGGTQVTFASGISFGSLGNLPNSLLAFNSMGIPYVDTGSPGTALAAVATIPITGSGVTRTIQINPQTGFGVLA